jgi:hypothetical protein
MQRGDRQIVSAKAATELRAECRPGCRPRGWGTNPEAGLQMLSYDRECPIAGHFLKVATTYVIEEQAVSGRTLRVGFALDTLGADRPYLVMHEVPLAEDVRVRSFLDDLAPQVVTGKARTLQP